MANDELMRLADIAASEADCADMRGMRAQQARRNRLTRLAADLRDIAQRAPQHGAVPEGWREEILGNIKRSCVRGRNSAGIPDTPMASSYVATCDHIENLADQALAAAPAPEAVMLNGLTEVETAATASVMGLKPEAERAKGDDFTGERIEEVNGEARVVRRDRGRFVSSVPAPTAGQPEGVEALAADDGPIACAELYLRMQAMGCTEIDDGSIADGLKDARVTLRRLASAPQAVPQPLKTAQRNYPESPGRSSDLPSGYVPIDNPEPPRDHTVVYLHKMADGDGFPAIADEWRNEHHAEYALGWHPEASLSASAQRAEAAEHEHDCPHSALDGCGCYSGDAQPEESP